MYPKARLDALSDGIFAVAMTLLVLDVRLPDDFNPRDTATLVHGIAGLWPKLVPYVLSFVVLGLRWLSNIQAHTHREVFSRAYATWWLAYHLLITFVPFTAMAVGRFPNLAPAIWLYAGNTIVIGLIAFRMLALTPAIERTDHLRERQLSLGLLIGTSAAAIAISLAAPGIALWVMMGNLAQPLLVNRHGRHRSL